mgnify:CR=1 FL=1
MNDYPGQMHNGYTFSLLPVLDKIYKDNKERTYQPRSDQYGIPLNVNFEIILTGILSPER